MKLVNGILGVTIAVSVLTGCNTQGNVQGEGKTVIVSEDVILESIISDAKVAVSQPEQIALKEEVTYGELLKIESEKLYFTRENSLYSTSLDHGKSTLIEHIAARHLSRNGEKALSVENNHVYVFTLETGEKKKLAELEENHGDVGFADPEGKYIFFYEFSESNLVLINTATNEKTLYNFNELFDSPKNFSFPGGMIHHNAVYLATHIQDEGTALYKLSDDHKVEKMITLKSINDNIFDFEFIHDDLLVFNGVYDEEPGIFFFDLKKGEVNKVVSGGTSSEGTWVPSYSISPDGTKMLFNTILHKGNQFLDNVFIASIDNNQLSKSIQIIQNGDLPAVIKILAHWNEDSTAFYIPRSDSNERSYSDLKINYISVYELDKIKTE
ncbi:hypothetical protein [Alkalihalobacterium elongatum]|uniref:hypothetical protein n=1 Tax=Alkalihalobacterium elongatum TaxID=2675466 RepID=UPI001C1F7991|nr:hypothetical protein [Alkalihalobacterium elongatum]